MGFASLDVPSADMEAVVTRLESLGPVASREVSGLGLGDLLTSKPDALGVIHLAFGEPPAISPGPDQAGQSIRDRLRDGFVVMYTSLGLIAYGLVVMVPWLLIVLLPAWLLYRLVRRRKLQTSNFQSA